MDKVLCLIPAKGNSSRLPKKNLLPLGGHPLVGISILKARATSLFSEIVVSTDCPDIAKVSSDYGVNVLEFRPENLSKDPATIYDVVKYEYNKALGQGVDYSMVFVLLPTSPFVSTQQIKQAVKNLEMSQHGSLLSVCPTDFPPYNSFVIDEKEECGMTLSPAFPDSIYRYTKSTECPTAYRSNGAILGIKKTTILNFSNYRDAGLIPFVMSREESVDIDTLFDYQLSLFMLANNDLKLDREIFK